MRDLVAERRAAFPSSGEINFTVTDAPLAIARIRSTFEPDAVALDETDGLSRDTREWRFNLRRLNTEPLLRLYLEARGALELVATKLAHMRSLITAALEVMFGAKDELAIRLSPKKLSFTYICSQNLTWPASLPSPMHHQGRSRTACTNLAYR